MKQKIVLIIGISLSLAFGVEAENDKKDTTMDRIETCKQNYTRLFGGEALTRKRPRVDGYTSKIHFR